MDQRFTEFAGFITALLRDRDLSQSDVARALGVAPSRVVGWKAGVSRPKPENLEVLAEVYALDLEQLLRMCRYRTRSSAGHDPDESEMLAIYRNLSTEDRPFIKRMLRSMSLRAQQKEHAGESVTDDESGFGRHMMERVQPVVPRRKYQSQSLASQRIAFGFQPA